MGEWEPTSVTPVDFVGEQQLDEVWVERVKEDIIWEGGVQSPVIPRKEVDQSPHPDLTKFWD
ncbi:hypothetical protein HY382_01925 [Candidatus Curtissbacteria bacterium]|nr:hypothetical protein [Candidatus Curtissbacteria bacterium]